MRHQMRHKWRASRAYGTVLFGVVQQCSWPLVFCTCLFPVALAGQPFDLSGARRAGVHVMAERGNSVGSGSLTHLTVPPPAPPPASTALEQVIRRKDGKEMLLVPAGWF